MGFVVVLLPLPVRKNVLLTVWFALPFVVVGVIFAWVFATFRTAAHDKVAPIGAGAGDTGGANAIGQWLEGARAEPLADPRAWPGGVELVVPIDAAGWLGEPDASPRVLAAEADPGEHASRTWVMHRREREFVARVRADELEGVAALLVAPSDRVTVVHAGGRVTASEPGGRPVLVVPLDPVDPGDRLPADALILRAGGPP